MVIANLWLVQHRVLTHVVAADDRLTRLLLLWTLTIVFLPFPTALVAQSGAGEQSLTKVLYVGCMTVSSLVLALICVVIDRGDRLRDSADGPDAVRGFATFATFVVILAVMLLFPSTSYWPLLLLLVPDRALALWRRRASGQQPQV